MLGCPSKPSSCCRWPIVAALILVGLSARGQWTLADPDPGIVAYTNFLGQGLSFVDFNLDGWDDLTLTNASGSLEFHAGGPQGFTPIDLGITAGAGRPLSLMWLDIDNDGDRDFLHTAGMSISLLSGAGTVSRSQVWINVNGTFVDRTEEWGFDGLQNRHAAGMAFHDIEGDGDLDVMVPVYSLPCEGHWVSDNVLFRQDSGAFVDVSMSSAIADGHRSSFQAAWMHLDDDELIDLFVINDAGVEFDCDMTNQAYLNNGDWTFSESSEALGLDVSLSSMSITIGDPDGDGLEEIFVTNQEADEFYPYTLETAGFFNRNADGVWVEQAAEVGLDEVRWSWSAVWVDQDLDGVEELVVATNPFLVIPPNPSQARAGGPFVYVYALGHNNHSEFMTCGVPSPPLGREAGPFESYMLFCCCMKAFRQQIRKKYRVQLDVSGGEGLVDLRSEEIWMVGITGSRKASKGKPKNVLHVSRVVGAMNWERAYTELARGQRPRNPQLVS